MAFTRDHVRCLQRFRSIFSESHIVVVDLSSGEEAPMNDIMKMMMAVATGHHVEFVTMSMSNLLRNFAPSFRCYRKDQAHEV